MNKLQKSLLISFITAIIVSVATFLMLSACSAEPDNMISSSENHARFQVIEKLGGDDNYDVIYVDTYTGVQYFVHHEYHRGTNGGYDSWGSVLVGPDGLPMLAPGYDK